MSLYRSEVWVAAPAWGAPPHPKNFINTLVFQKQELTSKLLTYFECPRDLVFVLISKFKLELHIIFLEQEAEILRFHLRTFLLKSVDFFFKLWLRIPSQVQIQSMYFFAMKQKKIYSTPNCSTCPYSTPYEFSYEFSHIFIGYGGRSWETWL